MVAFAFGSAQTPEIVDQTSRSIEGGTLIWASDEKWIAISARQGQSIRIYDLATGRFARQITLPGTDYQTAVVAMPSRDRLAVSGNSIDIYDVSSGTKVFTAVDSSGCTIQSIQQDGTIQGECTRTTGRVFHPTENSHRVWDAETGKLLREELTAPAKSLASIRDENWVADRKLASVGKQMLSSLQHRDANSQALYSLYRFTITDATTNAVVLEGPGMLSALSRKGRSAVVTTAEGLLLIQVPSGKQLQRLGGGPTNPSEGFFSAQTVRGGAQYLLSGLGKGALADAATGEIKTKFDDLPMESSGVISPSGTRMAYSQAGSVLLLNLSDTSQRQIIGGQPAPSPSPSVTARLYENAARNATGKLYQQQRKDEMKQLAKEERNFEKTLPNFNNGKRMQMEAQHQREVQRQQESRNSYRNQMNTPAMQEYATETWQSYTKFGAPAVMPPEADFLDSGRVLAVLAADLSWNTWDVATGNRLPFRTKTVDYAKLQSVAFDQGNGAESEDAIYRYLRETLVTAIPSSQTKPGKTAHPSAVNDVACSSQNGEYLIDVKTELDPKRWRTGTHRIVSVILRSSDGTAVDLLARNIDFSAFTEAAQRRIYDGRGTSSQCSLSVDGKHLVLEQLLQGSAKQQHLSSRERILQQTEGKRTYDSLVLYDVPSGKQICELDQSRDVDAFAGDVLFSPGMRYIATGKLKDDPLPSQTQSSHSLRSWDTKTCKRIFTTALHSGDLLGFSKDEKYIYVGVESKGLGSTAAYGVKVLDATTGQTLVTMPDAAANMNLINITKNSQIFFDADRENALGFWNVETGERLASMRALQEGEWLITTPSGYFDGSPRGWTQIVWRMPGKGLTTEPGELFFNEFYRPGLLSELLQGHKPVAPRSVQQLDRRQPSVRVSVAETKVSTRIVNVSISVEEALPDTQRKEGSGVRDLRLFRNGTLVKIWRGDLSLQAGKATFQTAVPVASGENQFVAYAFNHDNVKTADAAVKVDCTSAKHSGTAYILTVGVNHYANPEFDLNFAVPDAEMLGESLAQSQRQSGIYQSLIHVKLLDKEATKANILLALSLLAGEDRATLPPSAPKQLSRLKPLQPEDEVVVYFAGHGIAWGDNFYLVPHDLGYSGTRRDLPGSIRTILQSSISNQDLENAFEPMQAAHALLIIDACNSGKVLDSEEQRRGPMNNRGLAQLAYEKGIYVLTASQGYQAALESSRLGHGYLTYALVEEGLKTASADTQPGDGQVTASEWFDFAARRVPALQLEAMQQASENGRKLTFEADSPSKTPDVGWLQTPRFYYRRDLSGSETIIATHR